MAVTRLTDVVVPVEFTGYIVENTATKSDFVQSGIASRNAVIETQLRAGADQFNVPVWNDLSDDEANVVSDDPGVTATPRKLGSDKQIVRKVFLHNSWSAMNLASELSGDNAIARIQDRAAAYWTRQLQSRLIASLNGILSDNQVNHGADMVFDATSESNPAFGAAHVIDAAHTMGDRMSDLVAIGMHSDTFKTALKNDLIDTEVPSEGNPIRTFRGLAVIVDDGLPKDTQSDSTSIYTSVLFRRGAVGWGLTEPRIAAGTEVENLPGAGNGGGQEILHSRVNLAVHPEGFTWDESSVAGASPTIAELEDATNWDRTAERDNVGIAFLKTQE